MNVSSVSSTTNSYQNNVQSWFKQLAQDFKAVGTALQSGDLATAQQAFAAFQNDLQNNSQTTQASQSSNSTSQIDQDFQALQSAFQSGDLSSAQKAFTTLQQDLQVARGSHAHHAHHHHRAQSTNDGDSDESGQSTTATSTDNTTSQSTGVTLDQQA